MLTNCTGPQSSKAWVYPAVFTDGSKAGCPPEGEILWLDLSDAQIEALSIPRWTKTLYHNLHDYGWMLEDTSGGSAPSLQLVSDYSWILNGRPSQWAPMFSEMAAEGSSVNSNGSTTSVAIPIASGLTTSHLHWLQYNGGAF